jgi:ABC-type phosphate transport system substrate-binding protein
VVAVVSARSTVTALSRDQVADIFLGKTARFPNGAPAVPIDQAEASAARAAFYTQFTGKSAVQMKGHWSKIIFTGRGKPPKAAASGLEARTLIAANPQAIGYIERASVDGSVKVLLQQ